MTRPPRSWLYVPGDRPDLFGKALASDADAVVIDLEDSVRPERHEQARRAVVDWASVNREEVHVRIHSPRTGAGRLDLAAVVGLGICGVRVAKAETAADVAVVGRALDDAGVTTVIYPLVESALGVENVREILRAHPRVAGVCLGESDLRGDLGLEDDDALDWIRTLVIISARAAGLPAPPMSVYGQPLDDESLRLDCERGRRLGFSGRSAIHPRQVPVINRAFAPPAADTAWARRVLEAWNGGAGPQGAMLVDGVLVDAAGVRRAEATLRRQAAASGDPGYPGSDGNRGEDG